MLVFVTSCSSPSGGSSSNNIKKIAITYDLNYAGAPAATTESVQKGKEFIIPLQTDFEYGERTLAGWSKNKDDYIGSNTFIDKTSPFTPTAKDDGTIYYAIWTKKITVKFMRGDSIESDKKNLYRSGT